MVVDRQVLDRHAVLAEHANSNVLAFQSVLGKLRLVEALATTLTSTMLLTASLLVVLEVL